jgi:N-acetyl-anhydromuramyl-L-alanine amidase AmpD
MKALFLWISILVFFLVSCAGQKTAISVEPPTILHSFKIKYSATRIGLLKAYAEAHYSEYYRQTTGKSEWPGVEIDPKVIVVHFTAVPTLEATMRVFSADTLRGRSYINQSGKANVGVQFLIDQDGSIYQAMPDNYFARHCIGLNHCAIGFENIGMRDITEAGLRGEPQEHKELTLEQVRSNAALIRHLKAKYPEIEILIGHQEYRQLEEPSHPGHKFFHENDPTYRTEKSDPGDRFLQALREELKDILLPGTHGQVFK